MVQTKNKKQVQKRQTNYKQHRNKQKNQVIPKTEVKTPDNSMKYLYLFVVVIAFTFAFVLLINRQNGSYLNDLESGFNIKPEEGKTIVARDMDAIYPKYYVVYTEDNEYTIYVYNYYETISQYELEFNRLINSIVDYNEKDKMIRYLDSRGYGSYEDVLENLAILVDSDNLKIY